jgi:sortase family protein
MRTNRYRTDYSVFQRLSSIREAADMRRIAAPVASLFALALVVMAGVILLSGPAEHAPPMIPRQSALVAVATPEVGLDDIRLPDTRQAPPTPTVRPLAVTGLHIVVPRLAISLPLEIGDPSRDVPRAGFAGATPENVALVYPGSRNIGDNGNTYIYAHARVGMFLDLWNARIGDAVLIQTDDGALVRAYTVGVIVARADPSDTSWLDASGRERLTLQTSTGPRPEDPRFIVIAYPNESPPAPSRSP